ncbi:helix-turn-helix domain-containing protein [Marinobacter lacisalsi]|uniref:Helix-turn-helix domain-containing protein n=1 Tax=Marinobacter lacisalsi TaxID=475979 RepID=A0ABV8QD27_9GAMM
MTNKNNTNHISSKTPRLFIWSREVMFLGTYVSRQEPYRTTQELMVVCLQGTLNVKAGEGPPISTRTCLIPPGIWLDRKLIESRQAVLGIYFLAPFSQDHAALASHMTEVGQGIFCHHADESAVIRAMMKVRNQSVITTQEARSIIRDALIPKPLQGLVFREYDPRLLTVAKRIRAELHDSPTLTELANEVNLSESRLEKLFKEQAGLPITQYRVRYRVFISTIIMALGYSVTEAALLAGFSNSAHLSRCYRQVNGVTPSSTFLNPPHLEAILDSSATSLVAPLLEGQPAI